MNSELIINAEQSKISLAITHDGSLVELQQENRTESFTVGNIYWGKVKRVMPSLNACFVNIGSEKEAFLHFDDLGENFNLINDYARQVISNRKRYIPFSKWDFSKKLKSSIKYTKGDVPKIEPGDQIMVQITKEAISTKGPRLTGDISFAGRHLVLIPFGDKIAVSTKIEDPAERARLKQLFQSIKPKNVGLIVRTAAQNKRVAELDAELSALYQSWEESMAQLHANNSCPLMIHEESSRVIAMLRDLLDSSYQAIHVNDQNIYKQIREYLADIAPESKDIVSLYHGTLPIFDNFGITKQIKGLFGKVISYKGGAYIVIEHTEALHVIDVNSGHRLKSGGREEQALEVNMGAAAEIARQMVLRDMGGIIVIDFIDMDNSEDRTKLFDYMVQCMQSDRAKHTILPLSKFGLMQITRQRVRPVLDVPVDESCPVCHGKGTIGPSILTTDVLERKIEYLTAVLGHRKFILYVHPYIYAYIKQGFPSLVTKWKLRYSAGMRIVPDQSLAIMEYRFTTPGNHLIDLTQPSELI